jgi:methionine-S-sulfoxide reductase
MSKTQLKKATFAGGCFWCMEAPFNHLDGVKSTILGYTNGHTQNPTYQEIGTGETGHAEAIEIHYDPSQISYKELLEVFWRNIDPTTENQQFADKGSQYRTAIFYRTDEEKQTAETSKKFLNQSGRFKNPIVTEVTKARIFYPAEEYHQNYYLKNPFHYKSYSYGSGRVPFLKKTWGDSKKK